MSDSPSPRYGRRSGPDAPRAVRFVNADGYLPGVTFVQACVAAGQAVAAIKDADVRNAVRQESDADRKAATVDAVLRIGKGKLTPASTRPIVTGKHGEKYNAEETCRAIVAALRFLHSENPPQEVRYLDRLGGESDRGLKLGRAGENPLGWSDAPIDNAAALKRASDAEIKAARERKAARSGENSPQAKHAARLRAEAEAAAEAAKPTRARRSTRRAVADASAEGVAAEVKATPTRGGRRRAAQTGEGSDAGSSPRRPRRPGTGR